MGKSAEAYYAEKLERLLQMQEAQKQKAQLSPPARRSAPQRQRASDTDKPAAGADRAYYEGFRSRMQQTSAARRQAEPRPNPSSEQRPHKVSALDSRGILLVGSVRQGSGGVRTYFRKRKSAWRHTGMHRRGEGGGRYGRRLYLWRWYLVYSSFCVL